MKKLLVSSAALAACAVPFVMAITPASAATPAISCTFDRLAQVNATPGVRVHTKPNGGTSPGLFPNNESIEYCASPATSAGGYTWVWAAGDLTNGQAAQGYVATAFLDHISVIH